MTSNFRRRRKYFTFDVFLTFRKKEKTRTKSRSFSSRYPAFKISKKKEVGKEKKREGGVEKEGEQRKKRTHIDDIHLQVN